MRPLVIFGNYFNFKRTDGRTDGDTDGRTDGRTEGGADGRKGGREDGRTDGWADSFRDRTHLKPLCIFLLRRVSAEVASRLFIPPNMEN